MAGEKRLSRRGTARKHARQQPGEAFAFGCDVILRLGHTIGAFNTKPGEVPAQIGQRAFMQKARDVIGREGQQLTAAKPDEKIVEFTLNALRIGCGGSFSKRAGAFAKRGRIARQGSQGSQQMGVRGSDQQPAKQRKEPRPCDGHSILCLILLRHGPHKGRCLLIIQNRLLWTCRRFARPRIR